MENLPKKPSKPSNNLPRGFQNPPKLISNKNRTPDTILDFKITPKSLKMSPEGNLSKNHLLKLSQPLPASLSLSQPLPVSLSLSQPLPAFLSLSPHLPASISLSQPFSADSYNFGGQNSEGSTPVSAKWLAIYIQA